MEKDKIIHKDGGKKDAVKKEFDYHDYGFVDICDIERAENAEFAGAAAQIESPSPERTKKRPGKCLCKRFCKRLGAFWIFYFSFVVFLALVIVVGAAVFYDFMDAYEGSLPSNAAGDFLASLDEDTLAGLMETSYNDVRSGYEEDDTLGVICAAVLDAGLTYTECAAEYSSESPVYDFYCGEPLFRLYLSSSDDGSYGFLSYSVDKTEVYSDWFADEAAEIAFVVPTGTDAEINGNAVTSLYLTGETYESGAGSAFENLADYGLYLEEYSVSGIIGEVTLTAEYGGSALSFALSDDGVYTSDFVFEKTRTYTVYAPAGAAVAINGVLIGEEYAVSCGDVSEYLVISEFESADAPPRYAAYAVSGLIFAPEVSAACGDYALAAAYTGDNECVFDVSDEMRADYVVIVPSGVTLYCNGTAVGEDYKTAENYTYETPSTAAKYVKEEIAGSYYTVAGLYAEPTFTVSQSDAVEKCGEDGTLMFYPAPDAETAEALRAAALEFTEKFAEYTYSGYTKVDATYAAVLALTLSGSDAEDIIEMSYNAIRFTNAYTIDLFETDIYGIVEYSDGCWGVSVDYSSHASWSKYEKSAEGTYELVYVLSGGKYKLVSIVMTQ
ncbi:MAG: hypothetical protein LUI61_00205 [Firmicutes bacterium]|nr:hypothetical protein [Bacillota bacterium]